jgi:hypothetical protein
MFKKMIMKFTAYASTIEDYIDLLDTDIKEGIEDPALLTEFEQTREYLKLCLSEKFEPKGAIFQAREHILNFMFKNGIIY